MEDLNEVLSEIEKIGLTPFLVCGSALFAYRDKSLPGGNSKSIGIGIYGGRNDNRIKHQKLKETLTEKGFVADNTIGNILQVERQKQIMIFFM